MLSLSRDQWDTSRYISDMSHDLKCALFVGATVCVDRGWQQNSPSTARAFGAAREKGTVSAFFLIWEGKFTFSMYSYGNFDPPV